MKIKTNDIVNIIAGKDKGKTAKVTKVFPKSGRIIVEGINLYKRHLKRQSNEQPGGIVSIERPLDLAKVMLVCPTCKKPTRVGYQLSGQTKTRICKACKAPIGTK